MTLRISDSALNHVVSLLDADVRATLGRSFESEIRTSAEATRAIFHSNADLEDTGEPVDESWDLDHFFDRVVEETQQYFHDAFIDTSWPACPQHKNHPLWLVDDHWTCDKDKVVYARLGELGSSDGDKAAQVVSSTNPTRLEEAFRQFAQANGVGLEKSSHRAVFALMLRFYAEVRADGCDPADDEDMLLLDWGSYDWGAGRAFEIDLTREVTLPRDDIRQLHIVFRFPNEGEPARIPSGNDWWGSPAGIDEFAKTLAGNVALKAVADTEHISVEIYSEKAR